MCQSVRISNYIVYFQGLNSWQIGGRLMNLGLGKLGWAVENETIGMTDLSYLGCSGVSCHHFVSDILCHNLRATVSRGRKFHR